MKHIQRYHHEEKDADMDKNKTEVHYQVCWVGSLFLKHRKQAVKEEQFKKYRIF